jgi:uncharacterized protein (TIGR03435 family)
MKIRNIVVSQIVTLVFIFGAVKGQAVPPGVAFDVAVIRQAPPPTPDTMRGGQFRVGTQINKGGAEFNFITLGDLIPYAYGLKPFQIAGPASMKDILKETRWNIQTRFPEGNANQVPEMVQALLAERFKLTTHHENREQPVYELVVAKGGPKLGTPSPADDAAQEAVPATPGLPGFFPPFGGPGRDGGRGPGGPGAGVPGPGGPGGGGRGFAISSGNATVTPSPNNCGIRMEFTKLTMSSLAETLTPFLDRPVVDATKLDGAYNVDLNLPMEVMFGMIQNMARNAGFAGGPGGGFGRGGFGGRGGPGGDGGGRGLGGPLAGCDAGALGGGDTNSSNALFEAVKQLGLRLEPRKAPFDTIVVDHIERMPTEN